VLLSPLSLPRSRPGLVSGGLPHSNLYVCPCKFDNDACLLTSLTQATITVEHCRCNKRATLHCPKCIQDSLPQPTSAFCSQECFKVMPDTSSTKVYVTTPTELKLTK